MKIKSDFILREMNDTNIVVAVGKRAAEFNGLITLNSTGVFLWKELEAGIDEEELVKKVVESFEGVSEEKAGADVSKFVSKLSQAGILDE